MSRIRTCAQAHGRICRCLLPMGARIPVPLFVGDGQQSTSGRVGRVRAAAPFLLRASLRRCVKIIRGRASAPVVWKITRPRFRDPTRQRDDRPEAILTVYTLPPSEPQVAWRGTGQLAAARRDGKRYGTQQSVGPENAQCGGRAAGSQRHSGSVCPAVHPPGSLFPAALSLGMRGMHMHMHMSCPHGSNFS